MRSAEICTQKGNKSIYVDEGKKEDGNISIVNSKEMLLKEAKICGTNENQYIADMKGISYKGGLCHAAG